MTKDIQNDDLHSAARGLRMWSATEQELDDLIGFHNKQEMFASKVIVEAAKQVKHARFKK